MAAQPLAPGETGYWISPHGEFHRIDDGEHEEFAADEICPEAAAAARDDFPEWDEEDSGDQEDFRGAVFTGAYAEGWIDAHVNRKTGMFFLREGSLDSMSHDAREAVKDFAVEHGLAVALDWWKGEAGTVVFDARPPAEVGVLPEAPASAASDALFLRALSGK